MKSTVLKIFFLAGTLPMMTSPVHAYDLPTVNLGLTSFLDGGLPAGPGWYGQIYFQDYDANKLSDQQGKTLPLPKTDLHYQVEVAQISYLSQLRVGDHASFGMNALVPFISKMKVNDGLNQAALKSSQGFSDILIGPFIQFDPIMGANGPKFVHRIEFQVNLPTGHYDQNKDINPSNHAVSFNPYWAATYWLTPQWTASTRIHYLYNFKNTKPTYAFGDAGDIQAGQAIHANFATDYAITNQLRVGINGYWLHQITDTKLNGNDLKGRREKVWALGPGFMYSFSQQNHVLANAYFEHGAENRPEGNRLQMRYVHHF
ncbi:transporter [Acinetobacter sp. B10A]|uniref:SphA family protein n=1 Tax=Acinetobacter baretiae TaxID=2605383 RepID=UPI001B3C80B8|nr:transporter [Acinetobacter baretiae]MBF7685420.1 transporter [Acinetobacter baretiae]